MHALRECSALSVELAKRPDQKEKGEFSTTVIVGLEPTTTRLRALRSADGKWTAAEGSMLSDV